MLWFITFAGPALRLHARVKAVDVVEARLSEPFVSIQLAVQENSCCIELNRHDRSVSWVAERNSWMARTT